MKYLFLFFFLIAIGINSNGQNINAITNTENIDFKVHNWSEVSFSFKTIKSVNNTWGYDIYKGDKLYIHQASIPGLSGNDGFKSKTDAEKVAQLVIGKLKKGEMPPSVSKDELGMLKVL
jgi:hypothetical protein